jgi:hypothetical protein
MRMCLGSERLYEEAGGVGYHPSKSGRYYVFSKMNKAPDSTNLHHVLDGDTLYYRYNHIEEDMLKCTKRIITLNVIT